MSRSPQFTSACWDRERWRRRWRTSCRSVRMAEAAKSWQGPISEYCAGSGFEVFFRRGFAGSRGNQSTGRAADSHWLM